VLAPAELRAAVAASAAAMVRCYAESGLAAASPAGVSTAG
jgi:hypothetical protein